MAEVQPSPPPRAAGGDPENPPVAPAPPPAQQQQQQRAGGSDWSEEEDPDSPPLPPSTTTVAISNAAQYIPPRAAERTSEVAGDGRSWYSWNGTRTKDRRRPPPPRQQQPQPPPLYPQTRPQPQQWVPPEPKLRPQLPHVQASPPPRGGPPPVPTSATARSAERDRRVVPDVMYRQRRTAALQRTAMVARVAAAGLCLAALAVLAADTRKGWALDSYSNYTQLRYSEAVNVIGFLYSVFQFFAIAAHLTRKKHLIPRPKGDYFDFAMDQVLAYLLISSSSSATARVSDWVDNWGNDPFPKMANSSIVISFLAFMVFAINSLISAYNLFRRDL
ncbi:CASP-like protein 4A2 [Lolium perenne]|uniref:CASP-like protein 4A2 n=1 Tax=Lolium perenne TaxID=4522 RepID=UPI0021EAA5F6|nr:CASP-like protein 4A2 [Lolium perenne]